MDVDDTVLTSMLHAASGLSPIDAEIMRRAADRIKVLNAVNEMAYVPHRALVESRDVLQKRFEKAVSELTKRETRIMELEAEITAFKLSQGWKPIETALEEQVGLFWVVGRQMDKQWLMDVDDEPVDTSDHPGRLAIGKNKCVWSALEKATHWMPLPEPPSTSYEVTCARCGKKGTTETFQLEEGDEWECPECYERCEREVRDALTRETKK